MTNSSLEISSADIDRKYSKYALPILLTYKRAVNTSTNDLKLMEQRFIETFEIILRYLTIIVISQFRREKWYHKNIEQLFKGLARPSNGHFAAILREILTFHEKNLKESQPSSAIAMIRSFYYSEMDTTIFKRAVELAKLIERPKFELPKSHNSFKLLFDFLVFYRNKAMAHTVTKPIAEYKKRIPALSDLIMAVMDKIKEVAEIPFYYVPPHVSNTGESYLEVFSCNGSKMNICNKDFGRCDILSEHLYIQNAKSESSIEYLDLFSLMVVPSEAVDHEDFEAVYIANEIKKSSIEYISYQNGRTLIINSSQPLFKEIQSSLADIITAQEGEEGLPAFMVLEVSEESERNFRQAQVHLDEDDIETAVILLTHAIDKSPSYYEAVTLLAQVFRMDGQTEKAHRVISDYLSLSPRDIDMLLFDAEILLSLELKEECLQRLYSVGDIDPGNPLAKQLIDKAENLSVQNIGDTVDEVKSGRVTLAHEFIIQGLTGSNRFSKTIFYIITLVVTAVQSAIFYLHDDLMMALTVLTLGGLGIILIWATFRLRMILASSKTNFSAFLRSRQGIEPEQVFLDLVLPVFGAYSQEPDTEDAFKSHLGKRLVFILKGLFSPANRFRSIASLILALLLVLWFLCITKHRSFNLGVQYCYAAYLCYLCLNFAYLILSVVSFHGLLRKLKFQRLHFSLIQHPKLSIRYLSHLSRRITFPLMITYLMMTFVLYFGPFIANIVFVAVFSLIIIAICFSYYSTIFLVRRVIVENKWRYISQFSAHFHHPFVNLIQKARQSDLTRIKELVEMRNFIDSMNVWPERKRVLIGVAFLFILIIGISTIGLSNFMTRTIMPGISRKLNAIESKSEKQIFNINNDKLKEYQTLSLNIKDVDDTVVVCWGDTVQEMNQQKWFPSRNQDRSPSIINPNGCQRCDWAEGVHGSMDLVIPFENNKKHLLIMAYNKVYKGFFYMGGGKLSYDIRLRARNIDLHKVKQFIRINTKEIGYVAYLTIQKEMNQLAVRTNVGKPIIDEAHYVQFSQKIDKKILDQINWIENELSNEQDALVRGLSKY